MDTDAWLAVLAELRREVVELREQLDEQAGHVAALTERVETLEADARRTESRLAALGDAGCPPSR